MKLFYVLMQLFFITHASTKTRRAKIQINRSRCTAPMAEKEAFFQAHMSLVKSLFTSAKMPTKWARPIYLYFCPAQTTFPHALTKLLRSTRKMTFSRNQQSQNCTVPERAKSLNMSFAT